ncbi:MAG: response regulator transcription factor [Fimbriimonadales bacterium]|nr:response regulator transcription factor [Fimbriimonadales bacterium]MCS7190712.1 response regulator transcription factor [Fimbriimonadales bacterium]
MEPIRLILAEDDPRLQQSFRELADAEPSLDLLGVASNGEQAVQMALQFEPQVVLMDIQMPRMDGIEATRRIKRALPHVQVVIWTIFGDDQHVFEAIKAGAIGYLLKESPSQEIVEGIHAAAHGESLLHPAVARRVINEFQRLRAANEKAHELLCELTPRETEILRLIAEGKRNKEIAAQLFITEKTVKNCVSGILFKLQVNSRTEAALLAVKQGLI